MAEDTPEGQLMRTMAGAFAACERALIASRTRSALAVKRGRGERVGSKPLGYRLAPDVVHFEPDPQLEHERCARTAYRFAGSRSP